MHRQIHELWGFGFLEDLDGKSPGSPMNKRDLSVKLEIVLNADGTVDKATIVRPSGILTFDVAAIDTVENAGPFEEPPQEIHSSNGKIYLHWTFHRDERQCSPYFADPFILDNPPGPGQERGLPEPAHARAQQRRLDRIKRNASPTEGGVQVPHVTRPPEVEAAAAAARAQMNVPAPDDPAAESIALKWLDGFEAARLDVLVGLSGVPFSSGGTVAASDPAELARMWRTILDESNGRDVKDWKVLSPAGYRAVFGGLPKGAEDGVNALYLAARIGKDRVTLTLVQAADGSYRITGFTR
jgi:TonB family protein